jgi:opacity protein-like surface antigen
MFRHTCQQSVAALSLAAALLVGASGAAQAQDKGGDKPRFYVGGLTGLVLVNARDYDLQDDRNSNQDNKINPAFGIYGGVRVADIPVMRGWPVSVEGGYVDFNRSTLWYKTPAGDTPLTTEGHASYLAARLDMRFVASLSVYTKLGVVANSVDVSVPTGYTVPAGVRSGSKTSALLSLGVQYVFDFGLGLNAGFTSFGRTSPGTNAAGFNAGLSYHF